MEELQKGDWVQIGSKKYQIDGYREFPNGDKVVFYDGDNAQFISEVKPIYISREILLKNRFKPQERMSLNYDYLTYGGIIMSRMFWNEKDKEFWYVDFETDYECTEQYVQLKYVHELQHILSGLKLIKNSDFLI